MLPSRPELVPGAGSDPDSGPFSGRLRPGRPALRPGLLTAVFVGGCVGGLTRYEIVRAWPAAAHGFPWSVFVVNVAGAFVLALLLILAAGLLPPTTYVRPLLGTGFCGALTTFSAVAVSADQLGAHGHAGTAAVYVVASVAVGLGAALGGLVAGRWLVAARTGNESGST